MDVYQYFGCRVPPFAGSPDPRFYHSTPAHAEALAALQYATHAGKLCTIVLGESGSGKSLIARVLSLEKEPVRRNWLWVHGLDPSPRLRAALVRSADPPQTPARTKSPPPPAAQPLPSSPPGRPPAFLDWTDALRSTAPLGVIIDDADGLQPQGWQELLALFTRDQVRSHPCSVFLLGIDDLVQTLATHHLERVQRRVFRTCRLTPLSPQDVVAYVRHRLTVAGGGDNEIFTSAALQLVHRFSAGNPALVNHLCDAALLEAFGDDRKVIDARDIVTTIYSMTATPVRRGHLPEPERTNPVRFLNTTARDIAAGAAEPGRLSEAMTATVQAGAADPPDPPGPAVSPPPPGSIDEAYILAREPAAGGLDPGEGLASAVVCEAPAPLMDGGAADAPAPMALEMVSTALPVPSPVLLDRMEKRLLQLESRFRNAVAQIRAARCRERSETRP